MSWAGLVLEMRRLAFVMGLLLGGCAETPSVQKTGARPSVPSPLLTIVESAPIETTLDHPDIPNAADVWLEMFRGAKRSIDVEHFYISNAPGSQLEPVLVALEQAATRGVRVRVLLDTKFYQKYPDSADRLAKAPGVVVRRLDLSARDAVQHAKLFVVDESEAYLGSQNMDYRALTHIQEIGACARVPEVVTALSRVFAVDWAMAGGEPIPPLQSNPPFLRAQIAIEGERATLLPTASPKDMLPEGVAWDLQELVSRIDAAKATLDVQVLTYRTKTRKGEPWTVLDDALRRAAARGVRVRLLVSDWSKRPNSLEPLKELSKVKGISIHFIVIPQSQSGFIPFARVSHAKYMVVDGAIAWIGTSNWEGDYFTSSRNVGLFIESQAIAKQLERVFDDGFGGPYHEVLDPERSYEPPRLE